MASCQWVRALAPKTAMAVAVGEQIRLAISADACIWLNAQGLVVDTCTLGSAIAALALFTGLTVIVNRSSVGGPDDCGRYSSSVACNAAVLAVLCQQSIFALKDVAASAAGSKLEQISAPGAVTAANATRPLPAASSSVH